MSVNLRVLVPDQTTNYVTNPSPRYDLTGYTAVGATITRTLDRSRFSIASVKVQSAGAALHEGFYFRVSGLVGISDFITASVYVRGTGKVRLRLINNPSGAEWFTPAFTLNDDRWHRLEISGNSTGSDDMRLYVETADAAASAITFYADGLQMERKSSATSYCDGSQEGCRWNLTSYATVSSRDATSRAGGRWVPLAGPCRPDNNLYVTLLGGFGMPPIDNQTQPWSNASGSFFQNVKVKDRTLTLSFFVKNQNLIPTQPPDPVVLHELRQQLIDIIKPDKTVGGEAFLFEYSTTESDRSLYIRARYDAGLEGSWDVRNQWVNSFPLRLLCVDPFWFEDDQEVESLGIKTTYSSLTGQQIWGRINGVWTRIQNQAGVTLQDQISEFAKGPDGTLYIGGNFNNNGFTRIAKWDGVNFTVLGVGGANGEIRGLDVAPDGTLYATGSFTTIGGVAANRVAKYNPVTNTWAAMGTGLNQPGETICVAPNGQVYVGGSFTTAGGVACLRIARWDGLQWRTVGATSGFDQGVQSIINGIDGHTLFVGGAFVSSNGGGVTYNCVASVDIDTNLISQLGYGLNDDVNALAIGKDGQLYAGGSFTASAAPGAAPLLRIAKYSGGQIWLPMGSGLNDFVKWLEIGENGELYVGGQFTLTGTRPLPRVAVWAGDTFAPLEFNAENPNPLGSVVNAIISYQNGDLYIGQHTTLGGTSFQTSVPKQNSVINKGTTSVYPLLYYTGAGTIRYILNNKTNQAIYLNLPVFAGEEIFIDFANGEIVSTVRGDLSYTILPGSEIRSIFLVPGENQICVLVTDDVNAVMQLRYQPEHYSADAVVDAEDL